MKIEEKEFGVCKKYINMLIIVGICMSWMLGLGLILIGIGLYMKYAVKYKITKEGVTIEKGLLNKVITSARYDKITDISLVQNYIYKKAYNMGTVLINTAGGIGHEVILKDIEASEEVKSLIEKRMKNNKK